MTPRSDRRSCDEAGAVAVIVALLFPVLVAFVGFSVDIGHWYLAANQQQKAADAAALAGVVYLPGDPTKAKDVAFDYAKRNGYSADVDTVVVPEQLNNPVQLKVTITQTVDNFFTPIVGIGRTTITRTGVAEYQGPVPMGSPVNTFGDEPLGTGETKWGTTSNPQFWAEVAGPAVAKTQGDAIQSRVCAASDDGCSAGLNTEYNPNGYFYSVTVPTSGAGKRLAIEIFDPVFAFVGDACDSNFLSGATNANVPGVSDEATRYRSGAGQFCTGDGFPGGSGQPLTTSFVFRSPTDTPWDPLSAPVIRTATCSPAQFKGYSERLLPLLDGASATADPNLQKAFRRWVRVCEIPNVESGDYLIQVRSNIAYGADAAGAPNTTAGLGQNRFSIRAAFVSGNNGPMTGSQVGIRIAGTSVMSMYANAPGAQTSFFLARVPSGSAGHVLNIGIFDPSDAEVSGSLKILPPTDSGLTNFAGCVATGPYSGNLSNCLVPTNNRAFQGRWQTIHVPIPADYRCSDLDPLGCWVKIQFSFPNAGSVHDTTTWRATMDGDPVRLIQ